MPKNELCKNIEKMNSLLVFYQNPYSHDMFGLVETKDSTDGSSYLYIQSQPNFGHRAIPMFDQPDLKACFELSAIVPEPWNTVTTGELLESPQKSFFEYLEYLASEASERVSGLEYEWKEWQGAPWVNHSGFFQPKSDKNDIFEKDSKIDFFASAFSFFGYLCSPEPTQTTPSKKNKAPFTVNSTKLSTDQNQQIGNQPALEGPGEKGQHQTERKQLIGKIPKRKNSKI